MNRLSTLSLARVTYLPKELAPGTLYVSEEYGLAGHLCACGCGEKIITPLNPAGWTFSERAGRPTLRPSIGSWQLPCRSHYLITGGRIEWAPQWSEAQIQAGRAAEQRRREAYYSELDRRRGFWARLWRILRRLLGFGSV